MRPARVLDGCVDQPLSHCAADERPQPVTLDRSGACRRLVRELGDELEVDRTEVSVTVDEVLQFRADVVTRVEQPVEVLVELPHGVERDGGTPTLGLRDCDRVDGLVPMKPPGTGAIATPAYSRPSIVARTSPYGVGP